MFWMKAESQTTFNSIQVHFSIAFLDCEKKKIAICFPIGDTCYELLLGKRKFKTLLFLLSLCFFLLPQMQNLNHVQNKHSNFAQNSAHGDVEEIMQNFGFGSFQLKRVKGTIYCVYFKSPRTQADKFSSQSETMDGKETKRTQFTCRLSPHKGTTNSQPAKSQQLEGGKKHPKLCFVFFWKGSWWPGTDEDLVVQGNI